MDLDTRFASKLDNIADAPVAFRDAMAQYLPSPDCHRLLAYSPTFTTLGHRSPATLLAISSDRWLVASDDADGNVYVDECRFENTLLLELTTILLYGQLKIDFVADDEPRHSVVHFDTVMGKLYHEAVGLILDGVDGLPTLPTAGPDESTAAVLEGWPLRFRNAVPESIPHGHRLLGAAQWPAVEGGFGRELAPAAALLATNREVVLISEEQSWGSGRESKYGTIVTHFPLVRLARHELHPHARFMILDLEMHASHGGGKLQIIIPTGWAERVSRVMEFAVRQKSDGHERLKS
jgi:hypothetical protein